MAYLRELPGGQKIHARLSAMHPARRTVRKILKVVEAQCASPEHATELVQAIAADTSLVTGDTQTKLDNLLAGGCVEDLVVPKSASAFAKLFGCLK